MSEKVLGAGIQRRGNLHQDGMLDHVGGNFWAELWDSRAFKRQRLKGSILGGWKSASNVPILREKRRACFGGAMSHWISGAQSACKEKM